MSDGSEEGVSRGEQEPGARRRERELIDDDRPVSADAWAAHRNYSPYRKESAHQRALRRQAEDSMGIERDEGLYLGE